MADAPQNTTGLIPISTAAKLIMVSDEWVRRLQKAGYIPKPVRGQYNLVGVVQGYIKWLKDEDRRTSKTAAASRKDDARTREIELRIAERERILVPRSDAEAAMDMVVGKVREVFAGLPSRTTRDIAFRKTIETAVDACLREVSDELDAGRLALATGRLDAPPLDETDA